MFPFLRKTDAASKPDGPAAAAAAAAANAEGREALDLAGALLATFTSHWQQVKALISARSRADDERQQEPPPLGTAMAAQDRNDAVLQYVDKLCLLLADERPPPAAASDSAAAAPSRGSGCGGPMLAYALSEGFFEEIVNWCIGDPACVAAATAAVVARTTQVGLLHAFEHLIAHAQQQQLLQQASFVGPLLALLSAASQLASDAAVDESLIAILHSLCVAALSSSRVLEVLFHAALNGRTALRQKPSFLVFSLLVPYVHREGLAGQRARDALLLVMAASASNDDVGSYIAERSDFCPVLAAGLSALYSTLPRKLKVTGDAWHQIEEGDYADMPEVMMIVNALSFCNAVIQVAHPAISAQLVAFIYEGFLIPVLGPALHQNSSSEIIAATAYLSLLLRHVSEPALMRAFLRFILVGHHDDAAVIDTLVSRIGGHAKMCIVSLSLFGVLLDLCCEDVMYQLVFRYLLPCNHVLPSQKGKIAEIDMHGVSADKFLSLIPECCLLTDAGRQEHAARADARRRLFELPAASGSRGSTAGIDDIPRQLRNYTTDYNDYLADARSRVLTCARRCRSWRFAYDGPRPAAASAASIDPAAAGGCESRACSLSHKYDIPPVALAAAAAWSTAEAPGEAAGGASEQQQPQPLCSCSAATAIELPAALQARPASDSAPARLGSVHGGGGAPGSFVSYLDSACLDEERHCLLAEGAAGAEAAAASSETGGALLRAARAAPGGGASGSGTRHAASQSRHPDRSHAQKAASGSGATSSPRRPPSGSVDAVLRDARKHDPGRQLVGPFLAALFGKLEQMMHNSLYINLMLTGIIAQLASYPQPLIRSFLLSCHLSWQAEVKTLAVTLMRLKRQVDDFARVTKDFGLLLLDARTSLSWKEGLVLQSSRSAAYAAGGSPATARDTSPGAAAAPHRGSDQADARKQPERRRLRLPSALFSRTKPKALPGPSGIGKDGHQAEHPDDKQQETPAARLEALTLKNAIYCAVVLEEFSKELAALAHEHAAIAAAASDEGYHSLG